MNPELLKLYARCRREKPFMLCGQDAKCSLEAARTILEFRELEHRGLVRLRAEPEHENYFDVYGEPEAYTNAQGHEVTAEKAKEELIETLDRDGLYWVVSEWFDGDEWQHADSIGMCCYRNPVDPFENCYVADLMQGAINAWKSHVEDMAGAI